jgi:hypothetical protein
MLFKYLRYKNLKIKLQLNLEITKIFVILKYLRQIYSKITFKLN